MIEVPLSEMEAANIRYEHLMADAARADRGRTLNRLASPVRSVATLARAVGETFGVVRPTDPLPPRFERLDATGNPLGTSVRTQPSRDLRCTAYAVASMMELWWCWHADSSDGVPHLSIESTFSGKPDLTETAEKAARGVVDEGFEGRPPERPRGPHAWKLEWRSIRLRSSEMPDAMCRALVDSGPLAISIDIYSDFHDFVEDPPGRIYRPAPTADHLIDAHAVCIVGFDRDARTWLVRNSNERWGRGGYGRIAWGDEQIRPEHIVIAATNVIHPVT